MLHKIEPSYVMQQLLSLTSLVKRRPPKRPHGRKDKISSYTHNMKRAIGVLNEIGAMNQRTLAQHLEIKAQSVSTLIKRLEHDGLIKKEEDPSNKSATLIVLTEEGLMHAKIFGRVIKEHSKSFLRDLSQEEVESLSTILGKIICSNSENALFERKDGETNE